MNNYKVPSLFEESEERYIVDSGMGKQHAMAYEILQSQSCSPCSKRKYIVFILSSVKWVLLIVPPYKSEHKNPELQGFFRVKQSVGSVTHVSPSFSRVTGSLSMLLKAPG